MALRCPLLQDEHIGSDSAAVCRQGLSKQKRFKCPRKENTYQVHESCFDLAKLLRNPDGSHCTTAQVRALLYPDTSAIIGDGTAHTVSANIVSSGKDSGKDSGVNQP